MASLDEELQEQQEIERERAENFAATQQQDQLQRQQAEAEQEEQEQQNNSPVNQLKNVAKDQVKQAGKKIAKKAIQETIVATAPYWGTALLILSGIALVLFVVIAVPVAVCNSSYSDALTGTSGAATAGAKAIFTASGICSAFKGGGGASGGGGGGGSFANTDQATRDYLAAAPRGITVNKLDCTSVGQTNCTSLDGMQQATVNEIVSVAQACDTKVNPSGPPDNKCGVEVTGGTESGHTEIGTCTHANGYKVDLSASTQLNNYITNPNIFNRILPNRSDGAPLYRLKSGGALYADERNIPGGGPHWDVAVGCS